ncbi:MAG: malate dehydrogenase [Omnitrophica WOR_2 bacterium RIFCSPHIGHO2_02_FULL_52_10]|nr:MAG: malate dehydrogenase [Omnitrophica WOR_2 bacterium RIFCSPHIGHO2_02_FULL_52_10]
MAKNSVKVAVTGAAGNIGYALLFRIASGQMFGSDTDIHLSLLEIKPALSVLDGVVMELDDCAFPLLKSVQTTADPNIAVKDVDWALLIGSVPRKEGMERGDLLRINGNIFTIQGRAISEHAKLGCKALVVGNPCNTNAYIAKVSAPNVSARNFFAMTMLDQHRACAQLAKKAGVDVADVQNVAIWGNHSSTQFPDFYHATIAGKPAGEVIRDEHWLQTDFIETVQKRGAAVIKARGHSSAASAANAVVDAVRNMNTPTKSGEFFSMAVSSDGSYGVDKGLMFSFPVKSDGKDWEIIQGIDHNDFAKEKIEATLAELRSEREAVKEII